MLESTKFRRLGSDQDKHIHNYNRGQTVKSFKSTYILIFKFTQINWVFEDCVIFVLRVFIHVLIFYSTSPMYTKTHTIYTKGVQIRVQLLKRLFKKNNSYHSMNIGNMKEVVVSLFYRWGHGIRILITKFNQLTTWNICHFLTRRCVHNFSTSLFFRIKVKATKRDAISFENVFNINFVSLHQKPKINLLYNVFIIPNLISFLYNSI